MHNGETLHTWPTWFVMKRRTFEGTKSGQKVRNIFVDRWLWFQMYCTGYPTSSVDWCPSEEAAAVWLSIRDRMLLSCWQRSSGYPTSISRSLVGAISLTQPQKIVASKCPGASARIRQRMHGNEYTHPIVGFRINISRIHVITKPALSSILKWSVLRLKCPEKSLPGAIFPDPLSDPECGKSHLCIWFLSYSTKLLTSNPFPVPKCDNPTGNTPCLPLDGG